MAIAVQLDETKAPNGCAVPTIVPAGEFYPGQAYELPDEQAQALLAIPDGPFKRASLKAAREQAATDAPTTETTDQPAAPEAVTTREA
jgi:hypothetical protein